MSFNYNDKDDAHKQSNYDWWKKHHNFIKEVEIDLSKLGVPAKTIRKLYTGIEFSFKNNLIFALYHDKKNQESVIVFNPNNLQSAQNSVVTKYTSVKQMINVIKLILLTHHKIYIHQEKLTNQKLLDD